MIEWLGVDDVIEIHQKQLARYGGPTGIRDQNLLESAVARPQQKYHYGSVTDVRELAAAYAFGIARNLRLQTETSGRHTSPRGHF